MSFATTMPAAALVPSLKVTRYADIGPADAPATPNRPASNASPLRRDVEALALRTIGISTPMP